MPHAECSMHLGECTANSLLTSIMVILAEFPLLNHHRFKGSYCHKITQAIIHAPNLVHLRSLSNSPTAKHFLGNPSGEEVGRNQFLSTCTKMGVPRFPGFRNTADPLPRFPGPSISHASC